MAGSGELPPNARIQRYIKAWTVRYHLRKQRHQCLHLIRKPKKTLTRAAGPYMIFMCSPHPPRLMEGGEKSMAGCRQPAPMLVPHHRIEVIAAKNRDK
jgi:hypothetical protein